MKEIKPNQFLEEIESSLPKLTPKGRILGSFIISNSRKAVFMTTKELAEACGVSEATVVRFVSQLGFDSYSAFLQSLRDFIDTSMTLPDRVDLPGVKGSGVNHLQRIFLEEMNNLKRLFEEISSIEVDAVVDELSDPAPVYVVGSRLSYTFAYYLGWSLTKIRKGVNILKGSDTISIERLSSAEENSLVILIATSRYPNDLIKLGKVARRLKHRLFVITDSSLSPLLQFTDNSLVVPSKSIPIIGHPAGITCILNYIVLSLTGRQEKTVRKHQQELEKIYLENDLLFNPHIYSP